MRREKKTIHTVRSDDKTLEFSDSCFSLSALLSGKFEALFLSVFVSIACCRASPKERLLFHKLTFRQH